MATIHYGDCRFEWGDEAAMGFLAAYRRKLDSGETLLLAYDTDDGDVVFVVTPGVSVCVEFEGPVDEANLLELGRRESH